MITVYAYKKEPNKDENYYEYLGLSTDTKSQDEKVAVNSLFFELDTGDFYYLETPAKSGEKEVLIPQQSFTGIYVDGNDYMYEFGAIVLSAEAIQVVFDGETYSCERRTAGDKYEYGGVFDEGTGTTDYSQYPLSFTSGLENDSMLTTIYVPDNNEHTIEVYVDSSTPAVWKKVGSGASPSGGDAVVGTAVVGTAVVGEVEVDG